MGRVSPNDDFPFREIGPVAIADVIMRAKESGNMGNGDTIGNGVLRRNIAYFKCGRSP